MATVSDGWRRASGCGTGECIEVRLNDGYIELRVIPYGQYLVASPGEFAAFVAGIRAGEFDDLTEAP